MKSMKPLLKSSNLKSAWWTCSRLLCLGVVATMALATSVPSALGQARTVIGHFNPDVRYPCFRDAATGQPFYPNDIEIIWYGPELRASDYVDRYNTGAPFNPDGLGWGAPQVSEVLNFNDTNNPANPGNGMNCVIARYSGAARPDLGPFPGPFGLGKFVHIGGFFKPTALGVHSAIWWTVNGVRVSSACDPKITFLCAPTTTTICIENPYGFPMYVYGSRYFLPATTALPRLIDLRTSMDPTNFGASSGWIRLPPPAPVICLQPWCRIYLKIPGPTVWRPVVFQIAASLTADVQLPPDGGPNPEDTNTLAIVTVRSPVIRQADANSDGVVGLPDYSLFLQEYTKPNPDLVP